jgi:hypothetical protein
MIERSLERLDLYPSQLLGDSGYDSAEMLGWLVYEHGIEPHVTVFDKSTRQDGTFSRDDFTYDQAGDVYYCPGGKMLTTTSSPVNDGATLRYRASKYDCQACRLKTRCCPKEPARYVPRSIYEGARDMARGILGRPGIAAAAQENRDAVRAPQTHPQARPAPTTRTERCTRRVPPSSHRPEPQEASEADTGTEPKAGMKHGPSQHQRTAGRPLALLRFTGRLLQQNRSFATFPSQLAFFRYTPDTLAVRPKLAAKCQFQTLASGSGFVRTRSVAWGAHHLLDELSEGAGFSGRCPSGREHGPEIDPGQFPILQHHLDRSIRDLGR